MAYEPYEKQTWVDGTTPIDAEHMNHIEDGISEAVSNVVFADVSIPFESQEDKDAFLDAVDAGKTPVGLLNEWMCFKYERNPSQILSFRFTFYGIDTVPIWNEGQGRYDDKRCFCSKTAHLRSGDGEEYLEWYIGSSTAIFPLPNLPVHP